MVPSWMPGWLLMRQADPQYLGRFYHELPRTNLRF